MAKKSSNNVLGLLAFAAIILAAVVGIINLFNNVFHTSIPTGIINMISTIFLHVVVLWCGWTYAAGCKKVWKYIYLSLVIVIVIGFIFGYNWL